MWASRSKWSCSTFMSFQDDLKNSQPCDQAESRKLCWTFFVRWKNHHLFPQSNGERHLFLYVTFALKGNPFSLFAASVGSPNKKNLSKTQLRCLGITSQSHPKFRNPSQGLRSLKKTSEIPVKKLPKSGDLWQAAVGTRAKLSWVKNHHPGSDRKNRAVFLGLVAEYRSCCCPC